MQRMNVVMGLLFVMAVLPTSEVCAAVIAGWDIQGIDVDDGVGIETNAPPYAFNATTSEVAHVESQLLLGAGVKPSTSSDQYGFKISSDDQTNSLAGAIAMDHYLEFSITVESGYALNLQALEMVGRATASACSNVVVMTSIDGFEAGQEVASAYPANTTGGFDTDSSGFGGPIDLSAPKYRNLTGTVVFRIYGWNSTSGSGPTYLRNLTEDDVIIRGTVSERSADGTPILSVDTVNGMARVNVEFEATPKSVYAVQHSSDLTDTQGWNTIAGVVDSDTNWAIQTTGHAGFYRIVSE